MVSLSRFAGGSLFRHGAAAIGRSCPRLKLGVERYGPQAGILDHGLSFCLFFSFFLSFQSLFALGSHLSIPSDYHTLAHERARIGILVGGHRIASRKIGDIHRRARRSQGWEEHNAGLICSRNRIHIGKGDQRHQFSVYTDGFVLFFLFFCTIFGTCTVAQAYALSAPRGPSGRQTAPREAQRT